MNRLFILWAQDESAVPAMNYTKILLIIVIAAIVLFFLYKWWKNRNAEAEEETEETVDEVDNTPAKTDGTAPTTQLEIVRELKKLKDQLDAGAITEKEYEKTKKKLLNL